MTCDAKRCRQPSKVGVLPTGFQTARFFCERHWAQLADQPGSVCCAARTLVKATS